MWIYICINGYKIGILFHKIYSKVCLNSERLILFLNNFLPKIKNRLIILDNAGRHRTKIIKDTR